MKYFFIFIAANSIAQSTYVIKGNLNSVINKEIVLKKFYEEQQLELSRCITDDFGNFSLVYSADYVGAAMLEIDNKKKLIVLLNHENFEINWGDLNTFKSLQFNNSPENISFDKGITLYQNTEEKKAGISYLLPLYNNDLQKYSFLNTEMNALNIAMANYLNSLPSSSYSQYYLRIRKMIADFPLCSKRYLDRFPQLEKDFIALDFNDKQLINSGLLYELLEAYVIAMESYGEKLNLHLNPSIDILLENIKDNPSLKQNIAEFLFNLFEKRSLFEASQHIAMAMLTDNQCELDDKHKALFEQYRKMVIGNVAPDIKIEGFPNLKLSDIKSKYKLIVFGASWCQKCVEEIPKLKSFYTNWMRNNNLEIVFISLDNQKNDYVNFIKGFSWISSCDYKGWETTAAKDYCVFGTPTMYLLDSVNTIKLKPISPEQINAWLIQHP